MKTTSGQHPVKANQCKWPPREGQKQAYFVVFVSFSDHLINQYWSSVVLEGFMARGIDSR